MDLKPSLSELKQSSAFAPQKLYEVLVAIMEGQASDGQIGAFLMGLSEKCETRDHIVHAARALREKAVRINAPQGCVDCCGTGGDGLKTLNISTAVAIISAASGAVIAKHGNRAASSLSGAADILEALDIKLISDPQKLEKALHDARFAFLMAPHHHASMARVAKIRKELGFRTLFNVLGPLSNPAGAEIQLIGVYDKKWLRPVCEALAELGAKKGLVVHGEDGLDEISLSATTLCAQWTGKDIIEFELTPEDFGLPPIDPEAIKGGDPEFNAQALRELLKGKESAYRQIVLANTAAVLKLCSLCEDLEQGVNKAAIAIDSGEAQSLFERYRALSATQ